jgi:hypothetical protein
MKEFVGNMVKFGVFRLIQVDVVVFPPRWHAFQGLAIVDSFDAHIELLHKSWVLNNPMPNRLLMSSFTCLHVMYLYAIRLHLKLSWPWEYFVRHGDGLVDNVGVW